MKLIIPCSLPGLNKYISAERTHRQKAAAMKRKWENMIVLLIKSQLRGKQCKRPVVMRYLWVEKDRRRDMDNISSMGRKLIQDALVKAGTLQNDGWAQINSFSDAFAVDKKRPRVEVEITEIEQE